MKLLLVIILASIISNGFLVGSAEGSTNANDQNLNHSVAILQFPDNCYSLTHSGTVRLIDNDSGSDPNNTETVVVKMWSDYDNRILNVTLTEIAESSRTFEGQFFLGEVGDQSNPHRITVSKGHTITAMYVDDTLPSNYDAGSLEVTASTKIKTTPFDFPPSQKFYSGSEYQYGPCLREFLIDADKNNQDYSWLNIIYPPPLKQVESGIPRDGVKCKESLVMISKNDDTPNREYDNKIACVKPDTKNSLVKRGWAVDIFAVSKIPDGKTYLGKSQDDWKNMSEDQVRIYHQEQKDDDFYTKLGGFLIKHDMHRLLEDNGIDNQNDDFRVFAGMLRPSLPPHISYQSVVNGTDGKTYLLKGGTHSNDVSNVRMQELVFYDTSKEIPIESITTVPFVTLLPDNGTGRAAPHDVVIHIDKNNTVTFHNELSAPVRIQESGSNIVQDMVQWKTLIQPGKSATISFNETGNYGWNARILPESPSDRWVFHAGGEINVIGESMGDLEFKEKLRIAGAIVKNSEIPWSGLGMGNNEGLTIQFNRAIHYMLPDAEKYYTERAKQLIPFHVPVIIR